MKVNNPLIEHRVKQLKLGDSLIAIDPCKMRFGNEFALIVGKRYKIIYVSNSEIWIDSEIAKAHAFDIDKNSFDFVGKWFR